MAKRAAKKMGNEWAWAAGGVVAGIAGVLAYNKFVAPAAAGQALPMPPRAPGMAPHPSPSPFAPRGQRTDQNGPIVVTPRTYDDGRYMLSYVGVTCAQWRAMNLLQKTDLVTRKLWIRPWDPTDPNWGNPPDWGTVNHVIGSIDRYCLVGLNTRPFSRSVAYAR